MSAAERATHWRDVLERRPERLAYVGELDGVVAGFAAAGPSRDDGAGPRDGELYAIYVDPQSWRCGVGRALEPVVATGLRAAGFTSATLWVIDDNPSARAFYATCGWAADGRRTTIELGGENVPIVRYRRPLR